MATAHQIHAAFQAQISAVAVASGLTVEVGIGWPPINQVQKTTKGGLALVSIYDGKGSHSTTRWPASELSRVVTSAGIAVANSAFVLSPANLASFTITGSVVVGDAIGVAIANFGDTSNPINLQAGVVYVCLSNDTPSTIATALAAAINADSRIGIWVFATVSGAQVTLTNYTLGQLAVQVNVGNGGNRLLEVGRRKRQLQIVVWTRTEDDRQAVSDPIDGLLAGLEQNFSLLLADGSYGQVFYENDMYIEDGTLADLYRRDFHVSVDYPVTNVDLLYSVLVPVVQLSNNAAPYSNPPVNLPQLRGLYNYSTWNSGSIWS